jgi:hypothetical protein
LADRLGQSGDGLRLVAGRLELAGELEVHGKDPWPDRA